MKNQNREYQTLVSIIKQKLTNIDAEIKDLERLKVEYTETLKTLDSLICKPCGGTGKIQTLDPAGSVKYEE